MGNPAGMAVEVAERDAITAGLTPYNTRTSSWRMLQGTAPNSTAAPKSAW